MAKYVFSFGGKTADGNGKMKELLGGKGANLAEMCLVGIPVPPGFTITTEVCAAYYEQGKKIPEDAIPQINDALAKMETAFGGKKFGDPNDPLLVSVRSGAALSMPGMMNTILNLGLTDASVEGLAKKTGKPYRLLTEAEWEYSARAQSKIPETSTPFSTGATINYKQANYDANFTYNKGPQGVYRQKTLDVGSLPRNAFGLHDMHGNVWEWVEDCYKDSYAGAPADGSAVTSPNCTLRIQRGGAWNYYPRLLRSAYRYASAPGVRTENAGFRVARAM